VCEVAGTASGDCRNLCGERSIDRSYAEIVRGLNAGNRGFAVVEAREIPAGWTGKNHAVWEGAKHATSDGCYLRMRMRSLRDGATARALRIAEETGAALVSFSPQQVTESWYESFDPFVYCRLAKYFSYEAVNDAKSGRPGYGQILNGTPRCL